MWLWGGRSHKQCKVLLHTLVTAESWSQKLMYIGTQCNIVHTYIKVAAIPLHKIYCRNTAMKLLDKMVCAMLRVFNEKKLILNSSVSTSSFVYSILTRIFFQVFWGPFLLNSFFDTESMIALCSFLYTYTHYLDIDLKNCFHWCMSRLLPNPVSLFMDRNGARAWRHGTFHYISGQFPFATFLCAPKEVLGKVIFV